MRALLLLLALALSLPAMAQTRRPAPLHPLAESGGPRQIGKFEDWTAATHEEGGQTICYAFTDAANSTPPIQGRGRVTLTVTERPSGRDAVAITAGFAFPQGTEVTVQVDQGAMSFYTARSSAFARDGSSAVAAFAHGRLAVARSPSPRGSQVVDTFNLRGFGQAYAAIVRACPLQR